MKKIAVFIVCLALIPLVAVMTAAAKQRFNDGPVVFSLVVLLLKGCYLMVLNPIGILFGMCPG